MKDEPQPRRPEEEMESPDTQPVDAALQGAAEGDDEERLKVLEDLYSTLENELEGDLDQEGSPRH